MKSASVWVVRVGALIFLGLGAQPSTTLKAQEVFALPEGKVGVAYEFHIQTEGGLAPLQWKLLQGELPPGIELLPSGTLRGVPTSSRREAFLFTVEVSDSSQPPRNFAQRFSLIVGPAPLRIVVASKDSAKPPLKIVAPQPESASDAGSSPPQTKPASAVSQTTETTPTTSPPEAASRPSCPDKPTQACVKGTLRQWDYVVAGKMPKTPAESNVEIEVQVNGTRAEWAQDTLATANTVIDKKKGTFEVWLRGALVEGETVHVRQVVNGNPGPWSNGVTVLGPASDNGDTCVEAILDCRHTFEASAYLGLAIDTFASGETRLYLNPNAPNGPKERLVGGIDFGYRLMGKPLVRSGGQRYGRPNQLWVYGETVHGVRSTDIDCTKNPTFLTCQTALAIPNRPADQILFTFRNATSLEGFTGFRYEFLSLQPGSISPANLYVKAQAGFLTVSGAPSAAKAIHHVGLGAITTKGDFQGSYLEFGFGRNDLFAQKRLSRWKVDGFLSRRIWRGISFFTQITVDTDIGPASDSIQSYVGFDFDLWRFKDWFKTKP